MDLRMRLLLEDLENLRNNCSIQKINDFHQKFYNFDNMVGCIYTRS